MPYNLHVSEDVDKPPHAEELPDRLRFLTATQMVQAAIGLDLRVSTLINLHSGPSLLS